MATQPTSLKIPLALKERIDRLARQEGESSHALMVRALESAVDSMERHAAFVREAEEADRRMDETRIAYPHEEVADWLRAKAAGRKARRPRPVPWRK